MNKRFRYSASNLAGQTLGDFQVQEMVGRGSMARVYRASQVSLSRQVALKVLEEGIFTPGEEVKRFLREAAALARLEHPNIVPIYAAGQENQFYYFAMRLIADGTLSDRMKEGVRLADALSWARHIGQALAYAHGKGVVHRDLKPSNVLIQDGVGMLADFGLARLRDCSTITEKGLMVGTPLYMAPEQTMGERPDASGDCFTLGVMLYQMVTGRHPFDDPEEKDKRLSRVEKRMTLFARIKKAEYSPLDDAPEGVRPAIEMIIRNALTPTPDTRYRNGGAMLRDLDEAFRMLKEADRVVKVARVGASSSSRAPAQPQAPSATVETQSMTAAAGSDAPAQESSASITPSPSGQAMFCFGRYEVLEQIGHGGQGVVYKAHDPVLDRYVALKVLNLGWKDDSRMLDLFWHEARIAARLNHPHILSIFDFGVEHSNPFFIMPLVEGPSVAKLVQDGHPMPPRLALQILMQTADALGHAHAAGVIHLDVKPGNILLRTTLQGTEGPYPKDPASLSRPFALLTDFTMAELRMATENQDPTASSPAKRPSGLHGGTLAYASPEQLEGPRENLGPASDLFSLGIVLHELLTGRRLFTGESASATGVLVMHGQVPPPSSRVPDIAPSVDALCLRLLERDPAARYQNAGEVIRAAQEILRA